MQVRSNKVQTSAWFLICLMVFFFPLTLYAQDIIISSDVTWTAGNYSYNSITINNSRRKYLKIDVFFIYKFLN